MSSVFRKNSTIACALRRQHTTHSMSNHRMKPRVHQTQPTRPYFRLVDFVKKTKECERSQFMFSSPFCSSSSSTTTSLSKVRFVGWYLGMVKSRPVLTKSITSALIYTAADLSSQVISRPSSEPFDLVRISRMASYGMIVLGPSLHFWFNFVSKLFPRRDLSSTFKKMVIGQALFGPIMTAIFFSFNARLQGESSVEIFARLKRDLLPTMLNGVMYWPVCDFITYKFVPVYLQPLVSNSFSYLWTIYMTYMASLEKPSTSESRSTGDCE